MRREFVLPEDDIEYLNGLALPWETIASGSSRWLLIHNFPIPVGYSVSEVTVALMIPPGYPVAQIDMAYFYPHLQLLSGRQIGALAFVNIDGKVFQRWSRHRTKSNPWRPGIDDLSTHLASVTSWIRKELDK
jgi:hypothetical protein